MKLSLVGYVNTKYTIETVTTNGCTYETIVSTGSCAACGHVFSVTRSPYMGYSSRGEQYGHCACMKARAVD